MDLLVNIYNYNYKNIIKKNNTNLNIFKKPDGYKNINSSCMRPKIINQNLTLLHNDVCSLS